MHPSDERLLALHHRELPADERAQVEAHVGECSQCLNRADALAGREARLFTLLRTLDRPAPPVSVEGLLRRRRGPPIRAAMAAALAGLLAVGGVAALVSPGFRALVIETLTTEPAGDDDRGADVPAVQATSPVTAGGVELTAPPKLEVLLPASPPLGTLELRLSDDDVVRFESNVSGVRFEVREGRVLVSDPDPGTDFVLTVPRSMDTLVVLVGDVPVLRKSGDAVAPTPRVVGSTVVRLSGGGPPPGD